MADRKLVNALNPEPRRSVFLTDDEVGAVLAVVADALAAHEDRVVDGPVLNRGQAKDWARRWTVLSGAHEALARVHEPEVADRG